MQLNPKVQLMGCASSLICLGGLVGGIYYGMANAKGTQVDTSVAMACKYAPTVTNGLFGFLTGVVLSNDKDTLEQMIQNTPPGVDPKAGVAFAKGCGPVVSTIGCAGIAGGMTYLGYAIGNFLGSQF